MKLDKSPTQLSLEGLRAAGWLCDVVERQTGPIKRDWCGMFDIIGVRPLYKTEGGCPYTAVIGVQTTSWSNVSSRERKIMSSEHLYAARDANMMIEVHGWRRVRGGGYRLKVVDLS